MKREVGSLVHWFIGPLNELVNSCTNELILKILILTLIQLSERDCTECR